MTENRREQDLLRKSYNQTPPTIDRIMKDLILKIRRGRRKA